MLNQKSGLSRATKKDDRCKRCVPCRIRGRAENEGCPIKKVYASERTSWYEMEMYVSKEG